MTVTATDRVTGLAATFSQTVPPVTPVSSVPWFGSDDGHFAAFKAAIPAANTTRVYLKSTDGTNGVPSTFPGTPTSASATRRVVSFKPKPPMVISGQLDGPLKTYLAGAGPNDVLAAWHEANFGSNEFRTSGYTATQFVQMLTHIKALAMQVNPGLRIGQILLRGPTVEQSSPWVTPGLDWYGIDGYGGTPPVNTAAQTFSASIGTILNVVPDALLAITETNDSQDTVTGWNQFFVDGYNLAKQYRMMCYLTWWGGSATSNPPTFDPNGSYAATLKSLVA